MNNCWDCHICLLCLQAEGRGLEEGGAHPTCGESKPREGKPSCPGMVLSQGGHVVDDETREISHAFSSTACYSAVRTSLFWVLMGFDSRLVHISFSSCLEALQKLGPSLLYHRVSEIFRAMPWTVPTRINRCGHCPYRMQVLLGQAYVHSGPLEQWLFKTRGFFHQSFPCLGWRGIFLQPSWAGHCTSVIRALVGLFSTAAETITKHLLA